jgi:hypothetical protein
VLRSGIGSNRDGSGSPVKNWEPENRFSQFRTGSRTSGTTRNRAASNQLKQQTTNSRQQS